MLSAFTIFAGNSLKIFAPLKRNLRYFSQNLEFTKLIWMYLGSYFSKLFFGFIPWLVLVYSVHFNIHLTKMIPTAVIRTCHGQAPGVASCPPMTRDWTMGVEPHGNCCCSTKKWKTNRYCKHIPVPLLATSQSVYTIIGNDKLNLS